MAIAHDASTSDTYVDGGSSRTFAHPCAGANRLLLVKCCFNQSAGQTITGITYNGVALTKVGDVTNSSKRIEVWRLVAPATGSNNIVITFSASVADMASGASSYTGVDQTAPLGAPAPATGTSTSPSVPISSNAGEVVVDSLGWQMLATDPQASVGAGQTQRHNARGQLTSSNRGCAGSEEAGAASVTMSWTLSVSTAWALQAVALIPVGAAPPEPASKAAMVV